MASSPGYAARLAAHHAGLQDAQTGNRAPSAAKDTARSTGTRYRPPPFASAEGGCSFAYREPVRVALAIDLRQTMKRALVVAPVGSISELDGGVALRHQHSGLGAKHVG